MVEEISKKAKYIKFLLYLLPDYLFSLGSRALDILVVWMQLLLVTILIHSASTQSNLILFYLSDIESTSSSFLNPILLQWLGLN